VKKQIIFEEIDRRDCKNLTQDILENVGKKIRKMRLEGGISQLDSAFYLFAEKSFISNLENGKVKNTTLLTLVKIAELFKIKVEDLLKDD